LAQLLSGRYYRRNIGETASPDYAAQAPALRWSSCILTY
jgi:hypothetical protein